MNILIVDNHKITPPLSGGPIRIVNLYNNLSKEHNLQYIGLSGYEKINNKKNNIKETIIPIKKYIVKINDVLTTIVKVHTFDILNYLFANINFKFKKIIKDYAKKSDILIASHPWFFPFLKNFNKFLVYDAHNCEYLLRKTELEKSIIGNFILKLIKKIEKEACNKSNIILACSEEDKNNFIKLYNINKKKIFTIPNCIDDKKIYKINNLKKRKNEKGIIFIGAYFEPNNEALDFIIKELAPQLKDYKFKIVGSIKIHVEKEYVKKKVPKNIQLFGIVNNKKLNEIYNQCDLAINPMFNGSGLNIKMLDYMQVGLPIITTKTGARGLNLTNKKEVIICKKSLFKRKILELTRNKRLYNKLKKNCEKVVKNYNSKKISKKLNKILENEYTNYLKL